MKILNLLLSIPLLLFALFCCFGFLASFEPVEGALAIRIGYVIAFILSVLGIRVLLKSGREG